jgi:hypothetical protein
MIDIKKLDGLYQQHLTDQFPDTTKMMPTGKDSLQVEAMKQALEALNNTDTHPISSAEQYFKETQAMEALQDAIDDAEEREWVGLTDEEILNLYAGITKSAWDCIMYARVIEARLKGMNHEPRQYKDLCGND